MATDTDTARAREQAKAQMESISQLVQAMRGAQAADLDEVDDSKVWEGFDIDRADFVNDGVLTGAVGLYDTLGERMDEDPLSIEVRGHWRSPGDDSEDAEYRITLCTGGPAVRIVGDLGTFNEPQNARIEYQDWFTPWIEYVDQYADTDALLSYAQHFYYGEST